MTLVSSALRTTFAYDLNANVHIVRHRKYINTFTSSHICNKNIENKHHAYTYLWSVPPHAHAHLHKPPLCRPFSPTPSTFSYTNVTFSFAKCSFWKPEIRMTQQFLHPFFTFVAVPSTLFVGARRFLHRQMHHTTLPCTMIYPN